jgi:hypothetical protein
MWKWRDVKQFYQHISKNNEDFLENLDKIPLYQNYQSNNLLNNPLIISDYNTITNNDIVESVNQVEELTRLYLEGNLVSSRMGCIETMFLLKYNFEFDGKYHKRLNINDIDKEMRDHTGLYYTNDKDRILRWWSDNTIEFIKKSILCSSYNVLNFDLILWSKLNIKGAKFYNYCHLGKIVLKSSEGKRILYIGSAVKSIEYGYNKIHKIWSKIPISNFKMYYLETPITTTGNIYPDENIIITVEKLVNTINEKYSDFDTAILGCGCYGPPIINYLSKIYKGKNLLYLGSACYTIFGAYTDMMPINDSDITLDECFLVLEDLPEGCIAHPEKKYWKQQSMTMDDRLKYYIGNIENTYVLDNLDKYKRFSQNMICYYRGIDEEIEDFPYQYGKINTGWWWGDNCGFKVDFPCLTISADGYNNNGLPVLSKVRIIDNNNTTKAILVKYAYIRHWKILETFVDNVRWSDKIQEIIWRGNHLVGLDKPYNRQKILEKWANIYNLRFFPITPNDTYYKNNTNYFTDTKLSPNDMCCYKYLLCIEGNDVATSLKWMLMSKSVVIMAPPKIESWLMEGLLKPFVHYVPLLDDYSNLDQMLEWCKNNDRKCFEIVQNANQWMSQFLDKDTELLLHNKICDWYKTHVKLVS